MSEQPQNIFVYGATGTIGRPLVRALAPAVENGSINLRLGVRDVHGVKGAALAVASDLDWPIDTLTASLAGTDTLFLLTGYTAGMIGQSERAIEAAKRAGVRHIVHLGAHAAADTDIEHLQWHLDVERLIEHSGMNWTHLRPNWLMQNILRSILVSDEAVVIESSIPAGRPVSWVDADDVGAIAAGILQNPARHHAQTYLLAPECQSFRGVAEIVSRTLNIPCEVRETQIDVLASRMTAHGDAYGLSALHYMRTLHNNGAPECADMCGIDHLLGRRAAGWPQFIARHSDVFRSRGTNAV